MLRHPKIDRVCAVVLALTLLLTGLYTGAVAAGLFEARESVTYAEQLFDTSRVHIIDIVMDDWETFLTTCTDETYTVCSLLIDGEKVSHAGIRGKGNTSLSQVAQMDSERYSFKIEFDHYQKGKRYHGLDKLCLNNIIQDATYMKDYLAYTLMNRLGVAAPLCAFAAVYVNGEYWGLYLAVESVEDSFLERNYNNAAGELYKPDSTGMGGGRGNGRDFDMDAFRQKMNEVLEEAEMSGGDALTALTTAYPQAAGGFPGGDFAEDFSAAPQEADGEITAIPASEEGGAPARAFGRGGGQGHGGGGRSGGMGGMSSDDTLLKYIDDDPDSYANIFDNAKRDLSDADKARLIASLKALSEGDVESSVDVERVIRYFVAHGFLVNGDSYTGSMIHNYYLYEQGGLLSMIPWDYNLAFGAFDATGDAGAAVNNPIDTPVTSGSVEDRPMLSWIFADEEYTELYHEIYREFMADIYESGWLQEEIARVAEMIDDYVAGDPTAFCSYEAWTAGVVALKDFCALRCESVMGQLEGTVPATADAQAENPEALIDAGSLNLSDMGSMMNNQGGSGGERPEGGMQGNGFPGGGFPFASGEGEMPASEAMGVAAGAAAEGREGEMPASDAMGMPNGFSGGDFPAGDGFAGGGFEVQESAGYGRQVWLWFGASVAALAVALIWIKRVKLCR